MQAETDETVQHVQKTVLGIPSQSLAHTKLKSTIS
jgi:hypothetical protein